MKLRRKIINIDEALCNGCKACIPACPEQAIQMVETPDGLKARLVKELFCDGLGACLGNCPTGALTIAEREADAYDDTATIERIKQVAPDMLDTHIKHIREHTAETSPSSHQPAATPSFGCPGSRIMQLAQEGETQEVALAAPLQSQLQQWPVQLHLVNPAAPYFKNADLFVVADCVPFAYADFHREFLKGKERAIAVGCPKLDDAQAYVEKIAQIVAIGQPKSITIVNMEVPCCFGLVRIVESAIKEAEYDVPVTTVTISIKGEKLA